MTDTGISTLHNQYTVVQNQSHLLTNMSQQEKTPLDQDRTDRISLTHDLDLDL